MPDLDHVTNVTAVELSAAAIRESRRNRPRRISWSARTARAGGRDGCELGHAAVEEALDRVAGFLEHAAVGRIARALDREHEAVRHLARPFAEGRRRLRAVERAVDLDRVSCARIGEFLHAAGRIEHAAPRLERPAGDEKQFLFAGPETPFFAVNVMRVLARRQIASNKMLRRSARCAAVDRPQRVPNARHQLRGHRRRPACARASVDLLNERWIGRPRSPCRAREVGLARLRAPAVGRMDLEVHPAHAAAAGHRRGSALLLRHLGDHRLGGDQQAGDRCRALQRRAHHLGRVDDALRTRLPYSPVWASKP